MTRAAFPDWLVELRHASGLLYAVLSGPEWRAFYDAGFSPSEAWAAHCVLAAEAA